MKSFAPFNLNPLNRPELNQALTRLAQSATIHETETLIKSLTQFDFGLHLAIICLSDRRPSIDLDHPTEVARFVEEIIEEAKTLVADFYTYGRNYASPWEYFEQGALVILENRISEWDEELFKVGFTLNAILAYHFNLFE